MASGDSLFQFTALANEPPSSLFATLDTRNNHPVIDFDAANNEQAVFAGVMPQHYGGNGIQVFVHYSMSTAVTGDIDLLGEFERIGVGIQDVSTNGFAAGQTVANVTVPVTAGYIDVATIAFTGSSQIDDIAVGDGFRFRLTKVASNDTAAGDLELRFVELRET